MRPLSQSEVIVAAILGGFVVYLAMNGKLKAYWSLLVGGGSGAKPAGTTSSGASSIGGPIGGLLGMDLGGLLGIGGTSSPTTSGNTIDDVLSGNAVTGTVTTNQNAQGAIFPKIPGASSVPIPQVFF